MSEIYTKPKQDNPSETFKVPAYFTWRITEVENGHWMGRCKKLSATFEEDNKEKLIELIKEETQNIVDILTE